MTVVKIKLLVVFIAGTHLTRCQNWRAPWNTTRRNWRTWDCSEDKYNLSLTRAHTHTHSNFNTAFILMSANTAVLENV